MTRDWREYLSGGGYLVLPVAAVQIGEPMAWVACLAAILALSGITWLISLRRQRAIADTPTARVVSAAQGYVELVGVGRPLPSGETYSPAHHLPCLWYRYRRYVQRNDKWELTESGESEQDFYLDDGSGRCLLHPGDAEVMSRRSETIRKGDTKIEEELLLNGDRLYVLGDFVSVSGLDMLGDQRAEMSDILADWKTDQTELHGRFDLDLDGRIDEQEWGLARQAARREVERRRLAADNQPVTHALRRPSDGRPHLIAGFPPEDIAGRYRWRTWLHGVVMVTSLVGLAAMLQTV